MQTALAKLKDLVTAGHHRQALKLAASWPRLGPHADAIRAGWAAASNPAFYQEIGKDPVALEGTGMVALRKRYELGTNGPGCAYCQSLDDPAGVCPYCGRKDTA